MSIYDAPLSVDSVLGDSWVARIKAEHERLGINCPCGNHPEQGEPVMTNIEARALAAILQERYDDGYNRYTGTERNLAAEARAGGRVLTESLAYFAGPPVSRDMMGENPARTWHYHIDPAGSFYEDDPRREDEAKRAWQRIAEDIAGGAGNQTYMRFSHPTIPIPQAEAMLDWPIYRAAITGQPSGLTETQSRIVQKTLRVIDITGDPEPIEYNLDLALEDIAPAG